MLKRNAAIRGLLQHALPVGSWLLDKVMLYRILRFRKTQLRLRKKYRINDSTPIRAYDSVTIEQIEAYAVSRQGVRFASTSGTTGTPKKIAYTNKRLKQYKADARASAIQSFHRYSVRKPTIFILSSLKVDDSFASYVLHEPQIGFFTGLIEPARYMRHPELLTMVEHYGANAVRFWLLQLSQPEVLYATNPSTIAMFLAEISGNWKRSTAMVREFCMCPKQFTNLGTIIQRTANPGYKERMQLIADSFQPISIDTYLSELKAWCSWDGGYVSSYLDQVKKYLPADKYFHIPMFSMSTEVIETLTCFNSEGEICFLPLAKGVLYEFLPENVTDSTEKVLSAYELESDSVYSMVVSDCYGLIRYQTDDLFKCVGHYRGLPDLRFVRRAGLTFSFTGEKLTGEQVTEAYEELRAQVPALRKSGIQLCCFPTHEAPYESPSYRLVIVLPPSHERSISIETTLVSEIFERSLSELNQEFSKKRKSGRLGSSKVTVVSYEWISTRLDTRTESEQDIKEHSWESQFKLSPLYALMWEDIS